VGLAQLADERELLTMIARVRSLKAARSSASSIVQSGACSVT
jgi:hypothetical protein